MTAGRGKLSKRRCRKCNPKEEGKTKKEDTLEDVREAYLWERVQEACMTELENT